LGLAALCAVLTWEALRVSCCALEIIIPWYVYPSHFDPSTYVWDDLAASSRPSFTAVINPANGPEPSGPNADYQVGLAALSAAQVNLLGYVTTRLPSVPLRPIADVKADIDTWSTYYTTYGLRGIFFDGTSTASSDVGYYAELSQYVRTKPGFTRVLLNPGVTPPETYFSSTAADTIFAFEGTASSWDSYQPPTYASRYASSRFGTLVYLASSSNDMLHAIDLAQARGFGVVYITGDGPPNPWDTLPSYWSQELQRIAAASVPAMPARSRGVLLLSVWLVSLGAFTLRRRRTAPRAQ
jgi:hypothetical protein